MNLKSDFCPELNIDKTKKGGLILHNNKYCKAEFLDKNSFLFKQFNFNNNSRMKKTYIVKEHTQNNGTLDSIIFFAITANEFKEKHSLYKKSLK